MAANSGGQRTFRARAAIFGGTRATVMAFLLAGFYIESGRAFGGGAAMAALVGTEAARETGFAAAADPFLVWAFVGLRPIFW
jgi:hypothetical protein